MYKSTPVSLIQSLNQQNGEAKGILHYIDDRLTASPKNGFAGLHINDFHGTTAPTSAQFYFCASLKHTSTYPEPVRKPKIGSFKMPSSMENNPKIRHISNVQFIV
ncbi:Hypothetical predicted protein [Marmota monax]|uniref:Uncharacterized protein n=1 Tax=Marmota monax TaxID=9995 RepID=A0A5E4CFT4_MARMO|nr:Hypothetical predicted protein [Marmota monax]